MAICSLTGSVLGYDGETIQAGSVLKVFRAISAVGSIIAADEEAYTLKNDGTWTPLLEFEQGSIIFVHLNAPGFDNDEVNGTPLQVPEDSTALLSSLPAAGDVPQLFPVAVAAIQLETALGELADSHLSSNVPLKNTPNTFTEDQTVDGDVTATAFHGSGAALTGITGATGGISNTGSTTVGADTDANGSGVVALQTRNLDRLRVENDGQLVADDASGLENLDGAKISSETVERDSFGRWLLPELQSKLAALRNGEDVVADILMIGDSNTSGGPYYHLKRDLQAMYGNAGLGYVPFGEAEGVPLGFGDHFKTGTWTERRGNVTATALGVNASDVTSSDAATPASRSIVYTGLPYPTEAVFHFLKGPGLGSLRYRFDAGSWTTVNCSAGSDTYTTITISGLSATVDHTFYVEVVSGTITVFGVSFHEDVPGVRVHRFGMGGITAKRYSELNGPLWTAGVAAFDPACVVISLGTNDKGQNVSLADHRTALETMISRIRSASPSCDIVIMSQHDNNLTGTFQMSEYAIVQADVARAQACAFLDIFKAMPDAADNFARGLLIDETGSYYHLTERGRRLEAGHLRRLFDGGYETPFERGGRVLASIGLPYHKTELDTDEPPGFYMFTEDGTGKLWQLTRAGLRVWLELENSNGIYIGDDDFAGGLLINSFGGGIYSLSIGKGQGSAPFEVQSRAAGASAIIAVGAGGQSAPVIEASGGDIQAVAYRVAGTKVVGARGAALTAANAGTINSGDATTDTVIGNMRTRIAELEARLVAHGLIA